MTEAGRLRLAIDLDGVLTEHPRPLAHAASARFGVEMPESAFVDSAGLNVPDQVRDWVYSPDGPAAKLQPDPRAAEFLRRAIALVGAENIAIVTARPEPSAEMTRAWLESHGFPECPIVFADLKAAVALRSGFSHAVEDSLRHARNYAAAGVRCFLVKAGEPGDKLDDPMIAAADDLDALFDIIAEHIARGGQDDVNDPLTTNRAVLESNGVETRPVIVISDAIHPAARDRLAAAARIVDVDGLNVPALLDAVRDADALVVRSETEVTEEVIAAGRNLRVVARAGVGVDNIDLNCRHPGRRAGSQCSRSKCGLRSGAHDRAVACRHPPDGARGCLHPRRAVAPQEDASDRPSRPDGGHRGAGQGRLTSCPPAAGIRDAHPRLRSLRRPSTLYRAGSGSGRL